MMKLITYRRISPSFTLALCFLSLVNVYANTGSNPGDYVCNLMNTSDPSSVIDNYPALSGGKIEKENASYRRQWKIGKDYNLAAYTEFQSDGDSLDTRNVVLILKSPGPSLFESESDAESWLNDRLGDLMDTAEIRRETGVTDKKQIIVEHGDSTVDGWFISVSRHSLEVQLAKDQSRFLKRFCQN